MESPVKFYSVEIQKALDKAYYKGVNHGISFAKEAMRKSIGSIQPVNFYRIKIVKGKE